MSRMMAALAAFYRRWKYVEEDGAPVATVPASPADGERFRILRAIGREERLLSDCRRHGRTAMARERESTLRSLRNRLSALDLHSRLTA